MRPVHAKTQSATVFSASALVKARTFSPTPSRNSHYKYLPFSFRTMAVQKEGDFGASGESFYLLLDFTGFVFIFSNLFLVTLYN